jgi:hypothetical protein
MRIASSSAQLAPIEPEAEVAEMHGFRAARPFGAGGPERRRMLPRRRISSRGSKGGR